MFAKPKAAHRISALLLTAALGCIAPHPVVRPADAPGRPGADAANADVRGRSSLIREVRYRADLDPDDPHRIEVRATLVDGRAERLRIREPAAISDLTFDDGRGPIELEPAKVVNLKCEESCEVRYRVDLSRAAEVSGGSFHVAHRAGDDIIAPAATWLLVPGPLAAKAPIVVDVHAGARRFAAGVRRAEVAGPTAGRAGPHRLSLWGWELRHVGYCAFGELATRSVEVGGREVELTILDGALAVHPDELSEWVVDTGASLEHVFGRFPVPRAHVFVAPAPGLYDVDWGRTLPRAGPSIVVTVGEHADRSKLRRDWILAHEMFHMGVPSFDQDGRWLDEGLATYYEPIMRARAGLLSERALWADLAEGLRKGTLSDRPLVDAESADQVYWGGAVFVLAVDVAIRRRTGGRRSLDDGLRAVLEQGGDATQLWTVARFVEVVDEAVGMPVLAEHLELARRTDGAPWSDAEALRRLLGDLGVERTREGGARLSPGATLSSMRKAISAPAR